MKAKARRRNRIDHSATTHNADNNGELGGVTRHLLVPGRGIASPEHWLQRWADAHPEYRWAPEPPGPPFILRERVAALDDVVSQSDEPAVIIAHSAGCMTAAVCAASHAGPVHAALLVTPPHLDGLESDDPWEGRWVVPRSRLPFRSVVVASRTDPYTTFEQFEQFAEDWGRSCSTRAMSVTLTPRAASDPARTGSG